MMTDASEGYLGLAADVSAMRVSNINSRVPSTALDALADADGENSSEGAGQPAVWTALPIDHMKQRSSRATAAVATTVRFPREISRL
jgi:hypothetical protein